MRLWHKDLIPILPRKQLLSQWRECCCIAKNITEKGTPNHILVNKIMDYPMEHFHTYAHLIYCEMANRWYKCNWNTYAKHWKRPPVILDYRTNIFKDWHTDLYLHQCYCNLQEKYDCGGIPEDEWNRIEQEFGRIWEKVFTYK